MFKKLNITCNQATTICDKSQYGNASFFDKIKFICLNKSIIKILKDILSKYQISVKNIDTLIANLFYGIFPAATFWVGLTGLFFLFRFLSLSHFAALFGAITIAFTTYIPIIIGAGHNSKFYAFNFIPWLFLGFFMILNGLSVRTNVSHY